MHPDYIHIAPPCGTSSAARNRPIPDYLARQGVPTPVPLRSIEFPEGLPNLSHFDKLKVAKANTIYRLCVKLIYYAKEKNISLSIENPHNSHFWNYPGIPQASFDTDLVDHEFHGCMLGGTRKRLCRWRATPGLLHGLDVYCNDEHEHAPWQVTSTSSGWAFSTAEEAAYPQLLCDRIYRLVSTYHGYVPVGNSNNLTSNHTLATMQLGKQPRVHKTLVSEFGTVESFKIDDLPENSKILKDFQRGDGHLQNHDTVVAGVYRTPQEFVSEAAAIKHPMDEVDSVPLVLKETIQFLVDNDAATISKYRLHQLKTAISFAKELETEEKVLHSTMDSHVADILGTKKICLFKKLLDLTGYPDSEQLCSEISGGFDLVGKASKSHVLPKRFRPASISVAELKSTAVWNRKNIASNAKLTGEDDLDRQLWDETINEVNKKWLRGPFNEQQITHELATDKWICIRRFALQQSDKVRIIDDCREPKMNTALSTPEKLELMGVDNLVNSALHLARIQNQLHESCRRQVLGRTLDLTAAYKNLACSPPTRWTSVLLVLNPDSSEVCYFISDALMFGSTASVYAFNRCARALWHIAVVWLKLVVTQFYDDYPSLEFSDSSKGARLCFESILQLLGWETSTNPKKSLPFSSVFKMLGVQVDLDHLIHGRVLVNNTEQRKSQILTEIKGIQSKGFLERSSAASLHGKLNFALSTVFGSGAVPGIRIVSEIASGKRNGKLDATSREALTSVVHFLVHSKPRVLSIHDNTKPLVIFTDASYESGVAKYGVVAFFDSDTFVVEGTIPDFLVQEWKSTVGEQIISQAEIYPVVLSKIHFRETLGNRRVIIFLDNDSARFGLIKMNTPSSASLKLIHMYYNVESECPSYTWFSRVPSKSNPADWPSRGESNIVIESFGAKVLQFKELRA